MSISTPVDRYSFVAEFELLAGNCSIELSQIAPAFVIPRRPQDVPTGPAKLITRYSDRPDLQQPVEVLGPDPEHPERILIRR